MRNYNCNTSFILTIFLSLFFLKVTHCAHNYTDALSKSILFFQGQRSGPLPSDQKITWRSNSGLLDGSQANVNLTGGYYDAGDNVKFNFPMAYTTTMLSWSTIEFGGKMGNSLPEARAAIRWATDYLLKSATATPGKLYVGVGDPNADHQCWERPEDMNTPRTVYSVSAANPGSDVAGETAAALAAASVVFRHVDPKYSAKLLTTAKNLMQFALQYRGAYSDSLGSSVCPFYCSYSGYNDELLWGAAWLFRATNDTSYYNVLKNLGSGDHPDIFSWDNKYAGAHVLLSRFALVGKNDNFKQYTSDAESFMCKILPSSPMKTTEYTPGGLIFKLPQSNLQYVNSISFLLAVVSYGDLIALAKKQVDYVLGDNKLNMSYMVGYGGKFPTRVHHRGASLPSKASHPSAFGCSDGFQEYYNTKNPNPNELTGAIVGGPDKNDDFSDDKTDYSHSEPATYNNAAMVGPLAYFAGRMV